MCIHFILHLVRLYLLLLDLSFLYDWPKKIYNSVLFLLIRRWRSVEFREGTLSSRFTSCRPGYGFFSHCDWFWSSLSFLFLHKRIDERVQFQLGEVWSGHYRFSRDKLWVASHVSSCFDFVSFFNNLQNNIYKKCRTYHQSIEHSINNPIVTPMFPARSNTFLNTECLVPCFTKK